MTATAEYFDGRSAASRHWHVEVSKDALILSDPATDERIEWRFETLHRLPGTPRHDTIMRVAPTGSDARAIIRDPQTILRLRVAHPGIDKTPPRPRGTLRRIVILGSAALAAVAFIVFVAAPAIAVRMAETMAAEREIALGERVMALIDRSGFMGERCETPEGLRAIETMRSRLTEGRDPRLPIRIEVRSASMINAFALPGGQTVILQGLLRKASGPNAVAGVLAHEIGHVEHRDSVKSALRRAGSAAAVGLVFGDVLGFGAVGAMADGALNARYSRDAERAADAFAAERLSAAGVSTEGLAGFMDSMSGGEPTGLGTLVGYVASHPGGRERADFLRAQDVGGDTAILDDAQWAALRSICDGSDEPDDG